MASVSTRALMLDIGGVLLSKGWDRYARKRAAERFGYDHDEVEDRHQLVDNVYEEGDITLDRYLDQVVFFRRREFTREDYKAFMFAQSKPCPDMLDLIPRLKTEYGLRTIAVSNEGRELAMYRVESFSLDRFIEFFVFSSFVHLRKPDPRMYRMALDQLLLPLDEVVYIDDTPLLVDAARSLGIPTIHHTDYESTVKELENIGLRLQGGAN